MPRIPRLLTDRLVLRPFDLADAPAVERHLNVWDVVDTTLTIPHPYPAGGGATWIATHADGWARDERLSLAICTRDRDELVGAIGLNIERPHSRAEVGYWIAREEWGKGYATEAARSIVAFGLTELELRRVEGRIFTRNPASGRVLEKIGMTLEGVHRDACRRWDRYEDVVVYSILESELSLGRAARA
jgi:[ribosomal protein S5]-alanine N-acetyltransferase